jgi:hypothetical protein
MRLKEKKGEMRHMIPSNDLYIELDCNCNVLSIINYLCNLLIHKKVFLQHGFKIFFRNSI